MYSHILRRRPGRAEEPVGIRQLVGHLWLSARPSLWRKEAGWEEFLWALLLGAQLHAGKELLLDFWHQTQTSAQGWDEREDMFVLCL